MREFTKEDFIKLKEEIEKLKIDNNLFFDETVLGHSFRTFLHPTIRVMSPNTEESLNYSKQIIDFLLHNGFVVALGTDLRTVENPDNNNYSLALVERIESMYQGNKDIFLSVFNFE